MKLTNAQIYTLRRLSGGSKYQLRGDGKKGAGMQARIRDIHR